MSIQANALLICVQSLQNKTTRRIRDDAADDTDRFRKFTPERSAKWAGLFRWLHLLGWFRACPVPKRCARNEWGQPAHLWSCGWCGLVRECIEWPPGSGLRLSQGTGSGRRQIQRGRGGGSDAQCMRASSTFTELWGVRDSLGMHRVAFRVMCALLQGAGSGKQQIQRGHGGFSPVNFKPHGPM